MRAIAMYATIVAIAAICPSEAEAQRHPSRPQHGEVTILFENETDTGQVYNLFVENAPQTFHVPGAPRFAIMGKDHQFYLGITGSIKGTMSYDFGHPIDNPTEFITSAIPMQQAPGNGGLLQFSAATTSFGVNFVALPGSDNQIGAYINADFMGTDYGMTINFAYLKYRGLIVGYNYSLFTDLAAAPPTIDYEGAPALTLESKAVVDYTRTLGSHISAGIGLESPSVSATTGSRSYIVNQRIPDIPVYLQYNWNCGNSWIRLSAIMRNMMYRDVEADRNRTIAGWGVKLSGSASICSPLIAFYQAAYGRGITSYFQDAEDLGLDMVPDAYAPGRLTGVKAWGGYLGLQYNFSKNLFATVTYSQLRDYAPRYTDGTAEWNTQYRYAQYAVANVFYNIKSYLQWGVEYIWGRRSDMNGLSAHDNRIQTMLQLSF